MPKKLRHALTGAIYEVVEDGLVRVEQDGQVGLFYPDATWHSGELKTADPHMIGWVGGRQLGPGGIQMTTGKYETPDRK